MEMRNFKKIFSKNYKYNLWKCGICSVANFGEGACARKFIFQRLMQNPICKNLKVHKIEIFFGFDFEICIISLLIMSKY